MMRKGVLILSGLMLLLGSACSKDDEGLRPDPAGTATVNMMDEEHGATLLGSSPVRIDAAHNFYGPGCLLADVGPAAGLGSVGEPAYEGMSDRLAVIPGHGYVMLDAETLLRFPSGRYAKEVNSTWYRVYVEEWIVREEQTVGAVVKFAPEKAAPTGLPAWEEPVDIYSTSSRIQLPDGEYEAFSTSVDYVICEITRGADGHPELSVGPGPEATAGYYTPVYLRRGDIYTRLHVWQR